MKFHDSYKMFITEGVLSDETSSQREEVAQLLRYESSHTENGVSTGLKDYISRMQEGQRHIYYLCAPKYVLQLIIMMKSSFGIMYTIVIMKIDKV